MPIDADVDAVGIDLADVVAQRPPGFLNPPPAGFAALEAFLGGASSALSFYLDRSAPEVLIRSPASGSVIGGSTVTVTGEVVDRTYVDGFSDGNPVFGKVSYRVTDGGGTEVASGEAALHQRSFTIDEVPLGAGLHCIEVRAIDVGGNEGLGQTCLTTDPNAPAVALVAPLDGSSVIETSTSVSLSFFVPATLVSVNGAPDGRSFSAGLAADALTLPLALGANPARLVFDAGSGPFELAFTVFRVAEYGTLEIVSPEEGRRVRSSSLAVSGRAPRGTPRVEVNGLDATIGSDRVTFGATVPLRTGLNEIRAVELAFGRSDDVRVVRDDAGPRFQAVYPTDGAVTPQPDVRIQGVLDESARVFASGSFGTVSVGTTAFTAAQGAFPAGPVTAYQFELPAVALQDGLNAIELRAVDAAGNATTLPLALRRTAVGLALVAPPPGSNVGDFRTDLTLEAFADLAIQAVYVSGLRLPAFEGRLVTPGLFTLPGVPLVPGGNEVRIVYQRPGGASEAVQFPLVSTATGHATLTGVVTDAVTGQPIAGALVAITVNGQTVIVVTGADGRYVLAVEPGSVQGTAVALGFASVGFTATATGGAAATADVALASTGLPAFPNEVRILVPPDGAVTDWEQVTVVGTVLNPASSVSVNGVGAEVIGNRFMARHVPLAMGANTIQANASMVGLPTVSRSVAVERAEEPVPDVEIFSPPEGARVPGGGLVVRGWVSAAEALVRLQTVGIAAPDEGVFAMHDVFPGLGSVSLTATAESPGGTAVGDSVSLLVASADPALDLTASPASGEPSLDVALELTARVQIPISHASISTRMATGTSTSWTARSPTSRRRSRRPAPTSPGGSLPPRRASSSRPRRASASMSRRSCSTSSRRATLSIS